MSTAPEEAGSRDPLDLALDAYVEAWFQREPPDPDTFCRDHPECSEELRSRIDDLLFIEEKLKAARSPGTSAGREESPLAGFVELIRSEGEAGEVHDHAAHLVGNLERSAREYLAREEKPAQPEAEPPRAGSAMSREERLGPYRLVREIGRGGQGIVYLAEDRRLHRQVALKRLSNFGPVPEAVLARFWREAEVASRLEHPGICGVHDAGTVRGEPYIVMRYVEGETLATVIARGREEAERDAQGSSSAREEDGAPEVRRQETSSSSTSTSVGREEISRIIELFEKVARALHAAHEAQVIHRDIKPGNIMVGPDGQPVIMDFGLARLEGEDLPSITRSGDLFGTPPYMSPEQLSDRKIRLDRRTDVWSLGVALFESLALERPFHAPTRQALYQAILIEDPPNLRRLNRSVSKDLKAVVDTALAKSRDDRYQTALDFAEDLRHVRESEPITAKPITTVGRTLRWARREPTKALLLLVLLLTLPAISMLVTYSVVTRPEVERHRLWVAEMEKEGHLEAGYGLLVERDLDEAIQAFQAALSLDPLSPEAVAGIAIAHLRARRPEEALTVLAGHEPAFGDRPALGILRRRALVALDRPEEAAALSDLSAPRDSLDYYLQAAQLSHLGSQHGDPEAWRRALAATTRALLLAAGPRFLLFEQRAHVTGHAGDPQAARDIAEALVTRWGDQARAHGWAGYALGNAGLLDEAAACFEKALDIDAEDLSCLLGLGNQLRAAGKTHEAIRYYRLAIDIDPEAHRAYHALGHAHRDLGELDLAIQCYRKSLEEPHYGDRDAALVRTCLANALDENGRPEEALPYYYEALEIFPDFPMVHYEISVALARLKRVDKAIGHLQRALEFEAAGISFVPPVTGEDAHGLRRPEKQDYTCVHLNLGKLLCDEKHQFIEAVRHFRKAHEYTPDDPRILVNLGLALCRGGGPQEAIPVLEQAIGLDPELAIAYNTLGWAFLSLKRWEAAAEHFETAHGLRPEYVKAQANRPLPYYGRGTALKDDGRFVEALAEFRKAEELAAGLPVATAIAESIKDCEWLIALEGRLPPVGESTTEPESPDDAIALADVASKKKRYALAAWLYRSAFEASPELAEDLWDTGHRFHAACDAALAGTGKDAETRDPEAMTAWRQQALTWLHQDLVGWRQFHEEKKVRDVDIANVLSNWRLWPPLAGVRDELLLAALPEAEQAAWRELWKEGVGAVFKELDLRGAKYRPFRE